MNVFINADDFGVNPDVNTAIKKCFEYHYIQQTTIMVNMPYIEDAVRISKEYGFFGEVGLHLNLVTGLPLTDGIKKTSLCSGNTFNGSLMRGLNRLVIDSNIKVAVREEIKAQIEKYLSYGFTLKHLDSHRHSHTNPSILSILFPLLKNYKFNSLRLSRNLHSMGVIKDIAKSLENNRIISFNKLEQSRYNNCGYFGTLKDFDDVHDDNEIRKSIELMVHPIMKDGMIKDAMNDFGVCEWVDNKRKNGIIIG